MRVFLILAVLLGCGTAHASVETRYLQKGKIWYEFPAEDDVLRIYVSPGYVTKVELPESADLVLVGNADFLKVEVSSDKRSVILKALVEEGKTNLLVDTLTLHLNYEVIIKEQELVDYRVWIDPFKNFKTGLKGEFK